MDRLLTDIPWMLGALVMGLLIGSYIGQSSGLWWLIVGLAVVAVALGITKAVTRARRAASIISRT